jgi:cyclase
VSVNTNAVENPSLVTELSDVFGAQCVLVAIDAKRNPAKDSGFTVCTYGGKWDTGIDAIWWARQAEQRGAGEILLTSIDRDGTKLGYDAEMTRAVVSRTSVPVIASGGCGKISDFAKILKGRNAADAALAASLFHFGESTVGEVKEYLQSKGVRVRL